MMHYAAGGRNKCMFHALFFNAVDQIINKQDSSHAVTELLLSHLQTKDVEGMRTCHRQTEKSLNGS